MSTSTVILGFKPVPVKLELTADADFVQTLSTQDGDPWPAGTVIELRIGDAVWPALIDGATATWDVHKDEVNALGPGSTLKARVFYMDGMGGEIAWMSGRVDWSA